MQQSIAWLHREKGKAMWTSGPHKQRLHVDLLFFYSCNRMVDMASACMFICSSCALLCLLQDLNTAGLRTHKHTLLQADDWTNLCSDWASVPDRHVFRLSGCCLLSQDNWAAQQWLKVSISLYHVSTSYIGYTWGKGVKESRNKPNQQWHSQISVQSARCLSAAEGWIINVPVQHAADDNGYNEPVVPSTGLSKDQCIGFSGI